MSRPRRPNAVEFNAMDRTEQLHSINALLETSSYGAVIKSILATLDEEEEEEEEEDEMPVANENDDRIPK